MNHLKHLFVSSRVYTHNHPLHFAPCSSAFCSLSPSSPPRSCPSPSPPAPFPPLPPSQSPKYMPKYPPPFSISPSSPHPTLTLITLPIQPIYSASIFSLLSLPSHSPLYIATVFAPTSVLTFTLNPASQPFCRDLRPPSPLPAVANLSDSAFCPVPAGPIAFAVATPLDRAYELVTLTTQIRVLDTSVPAQVLACLSVSATPLRPGAVGSVYGHAAVVFWSSVAIAVAYWLLVGAGRLAAAWNRGRQRVHNNLWSHVQGIGFVLASAVSGEHLSSSPALLRFGQSHAYMSICVTLTHSQAHPLCVMLSSTRSGAPCSACSPCNGPVSHVRSLPIQRSVSRSRVSDPFFAQTAWASLLYSNNLFVLSPDSHLTQSPFQMSLLHRAAVLRPSTGTLYMQTPSILPPTLPTRSQILPLPCF